MSWKSSSGAPRRVLTTSSPSKRLDGSPARLRKSRNNTEVLADLKSRSGGGFSQFASFGSASLLSGRSGGASCTSARAATVTNGAKTSPEKRSGYLVAPDITADMGERRSTAPVSMSPVTVVTTSAHYLRQKKNAEFVVEFHLPRGKKVILRASNQLCVNDIKERLIRDARHLLSQSRRITEEKINELLKDPADYVLKVVGIDEYITNETLPLFYALLRCGFELRVLIPGGRKRVDFIQVCSKSFLTPKFEMIPRAKVIPQSEDARKERMMAELNTGLHIARLVGSEEIQTFMEYEDEEISEFRRETIKIRIEEYRRLEEDRAALSDEDRIPGLPEYILGEPLPMAVPSNLNFQCNFPGETNMGSKISCSSVSTVTQVRDVCFKKYCRAIGPEQAADKKVEDYVLKVTGYQDYFHGEHQLISYDYIRKCIGKNTTISLSLVERQAVEQYLQELHGHHDSLVDKVIAYEEVQESNKDPIFAISDPFRIKLCSVERALSNPGASEFLFLHMEIYHSGHKLAEQCTQPIVALANPRWNTTIAFQSLRICNIPRGTRLCFTLYKRTGQAGDPSAIWQQGITKGDVAVAWVACQLITQRGFLQHGPKNLRMWVDAQADPIGTCGQNLLQRNPPILFVEFVGQPQNNPVYYPRMELSSEPIEDMLSRTAAETERLDALIKSDPLTELTAEDKLLLWNHRIYCVTKPAALPKFLLSIKWDNYQQVQEAHRLLLRWAVPSPMQALELLDAKFSDPFVRDYGVKCLERLADGECYDFMLQLTQVVKHEAHHSSALAKFLLKRAWGNGKIGHSFYWFLKAEMHLPDVAERYTILLEAFLRGSGNQRKELLKQQDVLEKLVVVANKIKTIGSSERKAVLLESLAKLDFPERFQLPLDQRMEVKGLKVEKCKYMDSKKLPLWLVWENAESIGKPILVIFKVGDDLRQDLLTLQMIKIMDKLWKNEGLDLLLNPYGCVATGDEIGMIEVVLNADTTANINKAYGGTKAVLNKDTLTKWIRMHNPTEAEFRRAQENFCISCAGYCVATFVLGIGDRHNDNIMVTKQGHLFHIDFGHFLGNFKKKFGFKRERAPFVFTPQYANVLGGSKHEIFQMFVDTCCRAYNILRAHSDMFINLFQLMLCTGIPELRSADDCEYLRMAFGVGLTDDEAAKRFTQLIHASLRTKTTILNDAIHVWVHS